MIRNARGQIVFILEIRLWRHFNVTSLPHGRMEFVRTVEERFGFDGADSRISVIWIVKQHLAFDMMPTHPAQAAQWMYLFPTHVSSQRAFEVIKNEPFRHQDLS